MSGAPPRSTRISAGSPVSDDVRAVELLLGRPSVVDFEVAVRCPHGAPAVLRNRPRDRAGRPFPTGAWLACRALSESVSRLEAAGGVRELERDPGMAAALADAHAEHAAVHDGHRVGGVADPRRVKCLHAQLAFGLARGGGPIVDWIAARTSLDWPGTCCLERIEAAS